MMFQKIAKGICWVYIISWGLSFGLLILSLFWRTPFFEKGGAFIAPSIILPPIAFLLTIFGTMALLKQPRSRFVIVVTIINYILLPLIIAMLLLFGYAFFFAFFVLLYGRILILLYSAKASFLFGIFEIVH